MQKIKLIISYDGSSYYGWQRQTQFRSVQEELEKACSKVFGEKIMIRGAGRTDAGVHSLGQCATFMVDTKIPTNKIPLVVNKKLPDSIVITDAKEVSEDFHPQYLAKNKTYKYQILNKKHPIPQMRNYTYFMYKKLNVGKMNLAAKRFIGTHDFTAFCSSQNTKINTKRTIFKSSVVREGHVIKFEFCGDGFLYNMIRIMIGTLVKVGIGDLEPSEIDKIIKSKDRKRAGITVPACGLTLYKIEY